MSYSKMRVHKSEDRGGGVKPESEVAPTAENTTLPQKFVVKYLGKKEAKGLWGIKHTRQPVDELVVEAR